MYVEAKVNIRWLSSVAIHLTHFFMTRLLIDLELTDSARRAGQWAQGSTCLQPTHSWNYVYASTADLCCGDWGSEPRPSWLHGRHYTDGATSQLCFVSSSFQRMKMLASYLCIRGVLSYNLYKSVTCSWQWPLPQKNKKSVRTFRNQRLRSNKTKPMAFT